MFVESDPFSLWTHGCIMYLGKKPPLNSRLISLTRIWKTLMGLLQLYIHTMS